MLDGGTSSWPLNLPKDWGVLLLLLLLLLLFYNQTWTLYEVEYKTCGILKKNR